MSREPNIGLYTAAYICKLLYSSVETLLLLGARCRRLLIKMRVELPSSPGDSSRGGVKTETRRTNFDAHQPRRLLAEVNQDAVQFTRPSLNCNLRLAITIRP
jgi:hypothetical protein